MLRPAPWPHDGDIAELLGQFEQTGLGVDVFLVLGYDGRPLVDTARQIASAGLRGGRALPLALAV
jgi:hypothetical protein